MFFQWVRLQAVISEDCLLLKDCVDSQLLRLNKPKHLQWEITLTAACWVLHKLFLNYVQVVAALLLKWPPTEM